MRLISPNALLYTEMITTGALIHGDKNRFLAFDPIEHPIALQLGGSDPVALAQCARMAADWQYDEVNLNVGCPSDRVKSGNFGACLMLTPTLVAECIHAMLSAVSIPITVKCRIGVDEKDSYEDLLNFIQMVSKAGCNTFIIHARKAWLQGLSPKQNREIPPLKYEVVKQLKQDFPHIKFILNGGIKKVIDVEQHLNDFDGVMLGREAYTNPYLLAEIDHKIFSSTNKISTREEIIAQYIPYIASQLKNKIKLASITRHLLGLFQGEKGARRWRRHLSENAWKEGAGVAVVEKALELMDGF